MRDQENQEIDANEEPERGYAGRDAAPMPGAPSWAIKVATAADLEQTVIRLSGHMDERERRRFRDKLGRYVRKPDRDILLAGSVDDILGFLAVIEEAPPPEALSAPVAARLRPLASCTGLFVAPLHRRRGIGAALVRRGEQWARGRAKAGLWLVTHRAASWYERHFGYENLATVQVRGVARTVMAKRFPHHEQVTPPPVLP